MLFQTSRMCESVGYRNVYRAGFHNKNHLRYEHSDQQKTAERRLFCWSKRCVPFARNVMCTSCVMCPADVMFAFGKRKRNTSHHFAVKPQIITMPQGISSLAPPAQSSLLFFGHFAQFSFSVFLYCQRFHNML